MGARYPGPGTRHGDGSPRTTAVEGSAGPGERLRDAAERVTIDAVHRSSTSAVRLLAAWQQHRRELSDRLDSLLLHGPTAVDRVSARAEELRAALEAERAAFEAFVAVAALSPAPSGPVPPVDDVVDLVVYPRLRSVSDAGV